MIYRAALTSTAPNGNGITVITLSPYRSIETRFVPPIWMGVDTGLLVRGQVVCAVNTGLFAAFAAGFARRLQDFTENHVGGMAA